MARDIALPDGQTTIYGVPDNVTREEVFAKYGYGQAVAPKPSIGRTILEQFLQGATANFGDEASDVMGAAGAALLTDESFPDLYGEARRQSGARLGAQRQEYPVPSTIANIVGAIPSTLAGGSLLARYAPQTATAIRGVAQTNPYLTAGGVGVGAGAVAGLGAGQGDISQRADDAFWGGVAGGIAGPLATVAGRQVLAPAAGAFAASPIGKELTPVAKGALAKINDLFGKKPVGGGKANAPVVLAEEMPVGRISLGPTQIEGNYGSEAGTMDFVPGQTKSAQDIFPMTKGQRTQNLEQQRLESRARAGTLTPMAQDAMQQAEIAQNKSYYDFVDKLAGSKVADADVNDLVENIGTTVAKRAEAAKKGVNSAYDLAKTSGAGVKIKRQDIQQGIWKGMADVRRDMNFDLSNASATTKKEIKRLANWSTKKKINTVTSVKLNELENFRSSMTQHADTLGKTQDGKREALFLRRTVGAYDKFMEQTAKDAVDIGDAQAINAFRDAVKQRREYGRLFERNKVVQSMANKESTPEDMARTLGAIGTLKSKKEALNTYNAIIKASGDQAEAVKGDLRTSYMINILKRAESPRLDAGGERQMLSAAKLEKELDGLFNGQRKLAEQLYGKDAVKEAQKAIGELKRISSSQPGTVNYSNTANMLIPFLQRTPFINRIPGIGMVAKAIQENKTQQEAGRAIKSVSEMLNEQFTPQSTLWATTAPAAVAPAAVNSIEE